MKPMLKAFSAALVLLAVLIPLGQFSDAHSQTAPLSTQAVAYIENVLPIDLGHYEINFVNEYVLPGGGGEVWETEAANYMLNSSDSDILVHFTCRDGVIYESAITLIRGSLVAAHAYGNLSEVAKDVLERYQAFTGFDSADLISLLGLVDENHYDLASLGDVNLTVSQLAIPREKPSASGIIGNSSNIFMNSTTFQWTYTFNGVGYFNVIIRFDNGVFSRFSDDRAVFTVGSSEVKITEEQAIDLAVEYVTGYGYDAQQANRTANLMSYPRNGSVLYPCWLVVLDFNQSSLEDEITVNVWADSGEAFGAYLCGSPLEANPAPTSEAEPSSTPEVEASPTSAVENPAQNSENALPDMFFVVVAVAVALVSVVAAVAVLLFRRRKLKEP